ncbi:MAG: ABC transporter permease [Firmicutes bacterium]|nr:ABC transporter permease [Bacillota bacterium]
MKSKQLNAKHILQSYGTILAMIFIIVIFSILRPGSFCTIRNFINITRQMAPLMFISIGATLIMSVNEFDLSVGNMASLGGVLAALMAVQGLPMAACFLLPMVICGIIGWFNGWIVAKFQVLSFITTLGMSTVLSGIIYRLTGGATVFENIPKSFTWLGTTKLGPIPLLSILMLIATAIFWFLMRHMSLGRKMYAIGGNEEAAKIAGINVKKYKNIAFALCAIMACVTGMLVASRVGSANTTAGAGYFLQSYAAVYIGCTVSREGVPNTIGTFVGAAILTILANGLTIMQMPTYMQDVITGAIIILAVIAQRLGRGDAK